eukprot:m.347558 g.347558  ORF g.347558 m.347558 type:complete len:52 (+) comp33266_c0_seq1:1432-1587(+)
MFSNVGSCSMSLSTTFNVKSNMETKVHMLVGFLANKYDYIGFTSVAGFILL